MWFRFYTEVLNDPKVQKLPADEFRVWVNLLCLAKENDGILPSEEHCAFAMRMDFKAFHVTFVALHEANLIDSEVGRDKHTEPHNWRKRQYKSDSSTERVKRYRKRRGNVTETPSDTESEPESEPESETEVGRRARGALDQPTDSKNNTGKDGATRLPDDWEPGEAEIEYANEAGFRGGDLTAEIQKFKDYWWADGKAKADWDAAWRIWIRRSAEQRPAQSGSASARAIEAIMGNGS